MTKKDVPIELKTVNWADSDIEGLKQYANSKHVENAYKKGELNCKIGAKITNIVQMMDGQCDTSSNVANLVHWCSPWNSAVRPRGKS